LAAVLGVGVLVALLVFADTKELLKTIAQIQPARLLLPIAATIASYVAMARSYQGIALAANVPFSFWEMFKITFVANSMNYVVATGGLSGFAVRLYFFTRRGVGAGTATSISLAQGLITNISLLVFLVIGFGYLMTSDKLSFAAQAASGVLLVACFSVTALVIGLLFARDRRRRIIFVLSQAADRFMTWALPRYKPARTRIWRFQRNLNKGIDFLLDRKQQMVEPTVWILIDWILTLLILYTAFVCLDYHVPFGTLVVGFAVGLSLSFVSVIPGGLGLMEGSMAAVFTTLGVPFETGVVATLIFRIAFHAVPLVTSLFFFHGLFVEGRAHTEMPESS
jgi:glycosyltransferase 2 family protein